MGANFLSGVAIVVCGLIVMIYSSWPKRELPEIKTLALWTGEHGIMAMAWYDGARSKDDINNGGSYVNAKLTHAIVIQGHPIELR